MKFESADAARAAIQMALSNREEESALSKDFRDRRILVAAVNIGGNLLESIPKVIERALVAAKRTGVIQDSHVYDGAVAGACRDAIMQVLAKAYGLNAGGKIGIARCGEHLSVCIFMSVGLLHLNEVAIGLGHRSLPEGNGY